MRFFKQRMIIPIFFIFLLGVFYGCKKNTAIHEPSKKTNPLLFSLSVDPVSLPLGFSADTTSYIIDKNLPEVSGILYSRVNRAMLWVEQDGGNGQFLYVYSTQGKQIKKIALHNTMANDAEDIAYGPDEKGKYNRIYLADIGDNNKKRTSVSVYTFKEPLFSDTSLIPKQLTAENKIVLKYPNGAENAEALFVDPLTNKMYVFSKQSSVSHVYTLDFPYQYKTINRLKHVGDINIRFQKVTAADISPDGLNILLKTLDYILYWKRKQNEDLTKTFSRLPVLLPYAAEVQGEAITWGHLSDEYFTWSEQSHGVVPELFRYHRKK